MLPTAWPRISAPLQTRPGDGKEEVSRPWERYPELVNQPGRHFTAVSARSVRAWAVCQVDAHCLTPIDDSLGHTQSAELDQSRPSPFRDVGEAVGAGASIMFSSINIHSETNVNRNRRVARAWLAAVVLTGVTLCGCGGSKNSTPPKDVPAAPGPLGGKDQSAPGGKSNPSGMSTPPNMKHD